MAKLAPTSIKYVIKAKIKAKGVVEKPDVIGAVFGQTEGLLGSELDLRELQRTGRIGRIEVNLTSKKGNSEGEIIIPSALDSAETSLIAATLETIERIGPCEAEITLEKVEDTRADKRKYVMDKAKKILKDLMESGGESEEISEGIKEAVRTDEITSYKGLPAGPGMEESSDIVIVEGRADILNLLRYGIKNTVAMGGTGIPNEIISLSKEKTATVFVDGDRGGKLIVKELIQKGAELDFIATAPEGKEVEELTQKEAYKALREKIPSGQAPVKVMGSRRTASTSRPARPKAPEKPPRREPREREPRKRFDNRRDRSNRGFERRGDRDRRDSRSSSPRPWVDEKEIESFKKKLKDIKGSKSACIFDESGEMLGKVPVADLPDTLRTIEKPYAVILDGKIESRLDFIARRKGIKVLLGTNQ